MKLLTLEGEPTKLQAGDRIMFEYQTGCLAIERQSRRLQWEGSSVGKDKCRIYDGVPQDDFALLRMFCLVVNCLAATHGLEAEKNWQCGEGYATCRLF